MRSTLERAVVEKLVHFMFRACQRVAGFHLGLRQNEPKRRGDEMDEPFLRAYIRGPVPRVARNCATL